MSKVDEEGWGDDVENQSGESLVSEGDVTWAKLCGIPSRYTTAPHHQRRTSVISQAGVLPGAAPTSPFQPKPPDLTCQHHHHHQHHTHNHRHDQNIYKEKQKIHRGELLIPAQDVSLRQGFAAPCMKSAGSA